LRSTADDLRALKLTPPEREMLEWALNTAIDYQTEQFELDEGVEPVSLADDVIYRAISRSAALSATRKSPSVRGVGDSLAKKIAAAKAGAEA
jgi:hypothetical protein